MLTKTLKKEIGKVRLDDKGRRTSDLIGRISAGEKVEVSFEGTKMIIEGMNCLTLGCGYGSRLTIKTSASRYAMYFGGRIPSAQTMMKWESEGRTRWSWSRWFTELDACTWLHLGLDNHQSMYYI
jgi:hypothetical protein